MTARYQILQEGGVFDHQTRSIIKPDRSTAEWIAYQEWLTAGGIPLPPSSIGLDDLATSKTKRCEEINSYAAGLRNKVIAGRSSGEMASWAVKLGEARAYTASSDPADAPTLATICAVRSITMANLIGRINAQATPFLQAEAYIDGIRGKHCDAVEAMTDVRDIVTYDWSVGWPDIP
jgi:hypothetical protein